MAKKRKKGEIFRFGVSMEQELIEKFDDYLSKRVYHNRSEAIRDLIRELLAKEKVEIKNENVFGVISYIYDHHQREIEDKITHQQHLFYQSIISSLHIHIDDRNCLEVIIVKNRAKKVKEIADNLFSLKGVKNGQLSFIPII